jgi:hypothetical protein
MMQTLDGEPSREIRVTVEKTDESPARAEGTKTRGRIAASLGLEPRKPDEEPAHPLRDEKLLETHLKRVRRSDRGRSDREPGRKKKTGHDGKIGRQERDAEKFARREPGQGLPFARLGRPLPAPGPGPEETAPARAALRPDRKLGLPTRGIRKLDAELLAELADQRRLRLFAAVDFPPGKLPEAGSGFRGRTLLNEDPVLAVGEHDGHDREPSLQRSRRPWHCLYLRPEPQGHGSLRPILRPSRT